MILRFEISFVWNATYLPIRKIVKAFNETTFFFFWDGKMCITLHLRLEMLVGTASEVKIKIILVVNDQPFGLVSNADELVFALKCNLKFMFSWFLIDFIHI